MRNNEDRLGAKQEIQDSTPFQQIFQQKTNNELNFIVPTEIVVLPSKGKFYPINHPLYGKDCIEIKQMTAKEEDILSSKGLLKKGLALDKLLESLIVDKNIKPDMLSVEDRSAIIVAARISGYGPQYDTSVLCPSCNTKVKYSFDLNEKMEVEEVEEQDIQVDENGCFNIQLPSTKWNVLCRPLYGADEKNLVKASEAKKKSLNDSLLMDQLSAMIVSIENISEKSVILKAINSMPAVDSRYLRKKYQEIIKPFNMIQNFVCSNCEYESEMEVPLSADFFWFK